MDEQKERKEKKKNFLVMLKEPFLSITPQLTTKFLF